MATKRSSASSSEPPRKQAKRQVTVATFKKWQEQHEKEHQTLTWLRCDSYCTLVGSLWCAACKKFEDRIRGVKNFSSTWIVGSTNQKVSNVLDHARSEQHKVAMTQLRAEQAKATNAPVTSYAPIAQSLLTIDKTAQERMMKKFDLCFVMAKENMAFRKYTALHELEARHGVDLGQSYATTDSARSFTHYIAESQRQDFQQSLSTSHFYSFLMDGTTDAGNIEDELIVILYCEKNDAAGEIKSCARYFAVEVPKRADADGLIACLGNALKDLGVEDVLSKTSVLGAKQKPILIGGGTDGASVCIGEHNGMKGKMQRELSWLFWAWCYAHRLELACKDALSSPLLRNITEMLLQLYYLYSKSPKKSRELSDIVTDLKEVFEFKEGDAPVRSQGSRWISHKRKAMQRVVERYGAYIAHLTTLVSDSSITTTDRARLTGYLRKWQQAKMLIGTAMYVDILKPPSLLSKTLQEDDLDVVLGLQLILKSKKSLKSLAELDPLQWPTVKLVLGRLDDDNAYQGSTLQCYNDAMLQSCKDQALADLKRLDKTMRDRLAWTDVKILRSILVFLDTQSWCCPVTNTSNNSESEDEGDVVMAEVLSAVEYITSTFRDPLEAKGIDLLSLRDETEDMVEYARKYLSLDQEGYRKIWYKLHVCPNASRWQNVLLLCELGFSLPFSNGRVERIFSSLKLIKTDRRTRLQSSTLSDLLEILVQGPSLQNFSPKQAVDLWWSDCKTTRRINQGPRKEYRPRRRQSISEAGPSSSSPMSSGTTSTTEEQQLALHEWDKWFSSSDSEDED